MKPIKRPVAKRPRINHDLSDRSVIENMWLWRHRQPSNQGTARGRREGAMSQIEAAARLGITTSQYTNLERGEATLMKAVDLAKLNVGWDSLELTTAELCFLARRRSGMMLKDVVKKLAVSAYTYTRAEETGADWVCGFWMAQGFRFPPEALPAEEPEAPPEPPRTWLTRPTVAA